MEWRAFLSVAILLICVSVVILQRMREKTLTSHMVDPQQLLQLIDRADRLVVRECPVADARVLFESRRREDLDDLKQSLLIVVPAPRFHCMCIGSPSIDLFAGSKHIARLTNHHGTSIRWSGWESDTLLADSTKWLDWFSRRGMDGPRA
jgi:hypothetical protein